MWPFFWDRMSASRLFTLHLRSPPIGFVPPCCNSDSLLTHPSQDRFYFPPPVEEFLPEENSVAKPKPNRSWPMRLTVGLCCFILFCVFVLSAVQVLQVDGAETEYVNILLRSSPIIAIVFGLMISTLRLKSSSIAARMVACFLLLLHTCLTLLLLAPIQFAFQ